MPQKLKLFQLLLGCKPQGRHTEQHDVFFGVATSLQALKPAIQDFWREAQKDLHIDAWREVTCVGPYTIQPHLKSTASGIEKTKQHLFFINLGGYRKGEFEEHHHKLLLVAEDMASAIALAKQEVFYKQTGFKGAPSHIDDKYGLDVDEAYPVEDLLSPHFSFYCLDISKEHRTPDALHLGYLPLGKL